MHADKAFAVECETLAWSESNPYFFKGTLLSRALPA
jgi:hypothetical protein